MIEGSKKESWLVSCGKCTLHTHSLYTKTRHPKFKSYKNVPDQRNTFLGLLHRSQAAESDVYSLPFTYGSMAPCICVPRIVKLRCKEGKNQRLGLLYSLFSRPTLADVTIVDKIIGTIVRNSYKLKYIYKSNFIPCLQFNLPQSIEQQPNNNSFQNARKSRRRGSYKGHAEKKQQI